MSRNTVEKLTRLFRGERISVQPNGCWEWTGALFNTGYGEVWRSGKRVLAHRVAYELANGPIADGLFVLHACDNPPCVNPDHLRVGSQQENMADMKVRGRASHASKAVGAENGMAKLTVAMVQEIRAKYAAGGRTMMSLAEEYGVDWTNIRCIVRSKTWRHC